MRMHIRSRLFLLAIILSLLLTITGMHLYLGKAVYLSWQQEAVSRTQLARVWAFAFTTMLEEHTAAAVLPTLADLGKLDGIVQLRVETRYGQVLLDYQREPTKPRAPAWFVWYATQSIPFATANLNRSIVSGKVYLTLTTDTALLYTKLWLGFYSVAGYFLAANLLLLVVFRIVLSVLLRPLAQVGRVSEGVLSNRFEQVPATAAVAEFRIVVAAFNALITRLLDYSEAERVWAETQQRKWLVDPLTGLHNRPSFQLFLDQVAQDKEGTEVLVLAVISLQRLDVYNRQFGELEGDALLIDVANFLQQGLAHHVCVIARLNGGTFAVITPVQPNRGGVLLSEYQSLHSRLVAMTAHSGWGENIIAVSAGIACFETAMRRETLVWQVEKIIYTVPELEKNKCLTFELDHTEGGVGWRQVLRDAIAKRSWVLFAAPVVDLVSNTVLHTEIWARVSLGEDRIVAAGEFLPPAIREELVVDVEHSIIASCVALLHPPTSVSLPLAINLSEHFIKNEGSLNWLEQRLHELGKHAQQLCFEVSERTLLRNELASASLRELLHNVGAHFGVDHFGMDTRALELIPRCQPNYLKLAGVLVREACLVETAAALVTAICSMANALGITVIGLHIEEQEKADTMKQLGVSGAQGYLFGSPTRLG